MKISFDDLIAQSAAYRALIALARSARESAAFRLSAPSAGRMHAVLRNAVSGSAARGIFRRFIGSCKTDLTSILLLAGLLVMIQHLTVDRFVFGAIRYKTAAVSLFLLAAVYMGAAFMTGRRKKI